MSASGPTTRLLFLSTGFTGESSKRHPGASMKKFREGRGFSVRMVCSVAALLLSACAGLRADTFVMAKPPAPSKKIDQAVLLLSKGQLKEADALLAQVSANNPAYLEATLGRAQIAITGKQLDQADRMVTAALKQQDKLPEGHNMKGLVLLLRKDNKGAKREFERAIELRPQYVTPRLYLAVMARVSGDFKEAASQYQGITVVAPRLSSGYLGEAESQMLLGQQDQALKTLEAWKAADPKTLEPYQVIANVYLASRRPQDAIQELKAALAKSPHDSTTLTVLGTAYADAGDMRSAEANYQAALAAKPTNVDAALRLGELEAGAGQTDKAIANFKLALQTDPNNAVACNNIAWLLAEQGKDLNEALRYAELAVKSNPKYVDGHDTLGWVRYRRGEYPQAVKALQEAKALAPANTGVAAHLGLAYAKAGDKRDALVQLKQAMTASDVSNRAEVERVAAELSSN
jgi:tetratricopeptide (TPR) repeat protein